jgi:SAM-dependent methyltransferase
LTQQNTYRDSHTAPGYGLRYDTNYSRGYYAALYREVETPILSELFVSLGGSQRTLLDFACGTGRITRLAIPHFSRVVGVDVSAEMLKRALFDSATFVCQDITEHPLEERFDVVTAFRFFLNAEEELRRRALEAIRGHIAPGGRLICNIHMNSRSPMGWFYNLANRVKWLPRHNTLSFKHFAQTLEQCGFEVEQVIWYGVLPRPGRYFARLLDRSVGPVERFVACTGLQRYVAQSFVVVARRIGTDQALAAS